jgi:hypothetical protein
MMAPFVVEPRVMGTAAADVLADSVENQKLVRLSHSDIAAAAAVAPKDVALKRPWQLPALPRMMTDYGGCVDTHRPHDNLPKQTHQTFDHSIRKSNNRASAWA